MKNNSKIICLKCHFSVSNVLKAIDYIYVLIFGFTLEHGFVG